MLAVYYILTLLQNNKAFIWYPKQNEIKYVCKMRRMRPNKQVALKDDENQAESQVTTTKRLILQK